MTNSTILTSIQWDIAHWMPGGHTRGTWGILSICLSTIVICTCSAYHDDVPRTRPENRRLVYALLELSRWAIIFLLLPEVLPSIAFEQLRRAYIIFMNMKHVQVCEMWYPIDHYNISYARLNRNRVGHSPTLSMRLPEGMPSTSNFQLTKNIGSILLLKDFSSWLNRMQAFSRISPQRLLTPVAN